jgi:hypothetical protein
MKKSLISFFLLGLLVFPLGYCKKSDELSNEEVNEIFNSICLMIADAMSQITIPAAAENQQMTDNPMGKKPGKEIITRTVVYNGTGKFAGISITGTITVNTEFYQYEGEYSFAFLNVETALYNPQSTSIIKSGFGGATFNGVANPAYPTSHSQNHFVLDVVKDNKEYHFACDYHADFVGMDVSYEGTVEINGTEYEISYP